MIQANMGLLAYVWSAANLVLPAHSTQAVLLATLPAMTAQLAAMRLPLKPLLVTIAQQAIMRVRVPPPRARHVMLDSSAACQDPRSAPLAMRGDTPTPHPPQPAQTAALAALVLALQTLAACPGLSVGPRRWRPCRRLQRHTIGPAFPSRPVLASVQAPRRHCHPQHQALQASQLHLRHLPQPQPQPAQAPASLHPPLSHHPPHPMPHPHRIHWV